MKLEIIFGRIVRVADPPINEIGGRRDGEQFGNLGSVQQIWNFKKHRRLPPRRQCNCLLRLN